MCVILLLYIDIFKCLKIHNLYIYDYSLAVSINAVITAHNARSRCRRGFESSVRHYLFYLN